MQFYVGDVIKIDGRLYAVDEVAEDAFLGRGRVYFCTLEDSSIADFPIEEMFFEHELEDAEVM